MFDPTKYTKSKFIKGADLPRGRAVVVTISNVYEHTFDQTQETKPALDFSDFDQGMVLNKTQVGTLIEMFGTDVRLWIGQAISLMAVPTQFAGKPTILVGEAQQRPPTMNGQRPPQQRPPAQQPPAYPDDQWPTEPPATDDNPF